MRRSYTIQTDRDSLRDPLTKTLGLLVLWNWTGSTIPQRRRSQPAALCVVVSPFSTKPARGEALPALFVVGIDKLFDSNLTDS